MSGCQAGTQDFINGDARCTGNHAWFEHDEWDIRGNSLHCCPSTFDRRNDDDPVDTIRDEMIDRGAGAFGIIVPEAHETRCIADLSCGIGDTEQHVRWTVLPDVKADDTEVH